MDKNLINSDSDGPFPMTQEEIDEATTFLKQLTEYCKE